MIVKAFFIMIIIVLLPIENAPGLILQVCPIKSFMIFHFDLLISIDPFIVSPDGNILNNMKHHEQYYQRVLHTGLIKV